MVSIRVSKTRSEGSSPSGPANNKEYKRTKDKDEG